MPVPKHLDVVQRLHAAQRPEPTGAGALAFVLRVIAELQQTFPGERVGLLIKTAGENVVPYGGTSVSASRLVYPDYDLLVKILTDVPTTNGPSWQTEEGIPTKGHHGGYLAVTAPIAGEPDDEAEDRPGPASTFEATVLAQLEALKVQAAIDREAVQTQINQVVENAEATGLTILTALRASPGILGLFGDLFRPRTPPDDRDDA